MKEGEETYTPTYTPCINTPTSFIKFTPPCKCPHTNIHSRTHSPCMHTHTHANTHTHTQRNHTHRCTFMHNTHSYKKGEREREIERKEGENSRREKDEGAERPWWSSWRMMMAPAGDDGYAELRGGCHGLWGCDCPDCAEMGKDFTAASRERRCVLR